MKHKPAERASGIAYALETFAVHVYDLINQLALVVWEDQLRRDVCHQAHQTRRQPLPMRSTQLESTRHKRSVCDILLLLHSFVAPEDTLRVCRPALLGEAFRATVKVAVGASVSRTFNLVRA